MLKINKIKLALIIWLIAVFSTFISPLKVYPLFFLLFIVSFFYLSYKKIHVNYKTLAILISISSLIIIFIISSFYGTFNEAHFSTKANIKLIINYAWLTTSFLFFANYYKEVAQHSKRIEKFFLWIFGLCFFQLFYKIAALGLWTAPFDGSISSSSSGYILQLVPTIFGDVNKNIFSTKVAFIVIMLITIRKIGYVENKNIFWLVTLGFLFMIYSLSRTGQTVYTLFIAALVFRNIYSSNKFKYLKPILYALFIIIGGIVIQIALNSFFHFDLSSNADGFSSRLILWAGYFRNIDAIGLIGKGALSASYFIHNELKSGESNFHNVFFNINYEAGWLGVITYLLFLIFLFFSLVSKKFPLYWMALFIPFFACINSHYAGYGPDEMIYLANSFNLLTFLKNK